MKSTAKKFILSFFVIISSIFYVSSRNLGKAPNYGAQSALSLRPGNTSKIIPSPANVNYKDGSYQGTSADAYYGNIKVDAVIQNGKLADVQFLDYPQDRRTSVTINTDAMPVLKSEAIQAQTANVDIVTGATDTSMAFQQSLSNALSQALGQ